MLPKEWNKKLIDCNVSDLTIEHIKWADKVLISAMIVQLDHAQKIIKLCKENGKTVVLDDANNKKDAKQQVSYWQGIKGKGWKVFSKVK